VKKKDEKDEDCKQRGWRQTDSEKERRQQNEGKWNTNGPPNCNKHRDSVSVNIPKCAPNQYGECDYKQIDRERVHV